MHWALLALALGGGNGVGSGGLQGFPATPLASGSQASNNVVMATTAAVSLFVDPTGSDSNACTAAGASACLTIQGALNKAPKMLRHGVTVTVAAGTYGGFIVSGFTCDPSIQTATGGLMVDGFAVFAASTLATGSATGTFTSSTAGSGTTFGTGTNSGATWTVNDLTGRFITAGSTTRLISSNTATTITISGTWTSPGAVAYTIQDPGVIINSSVSAPATPLLSASSTIGAGVILEGNNCAARGGTIEVRGMRIAPPTGAGVLYADTSGGELSLSQVRASTSGVVEIGTGSTSTNYTSPVGRVLLTDVDVQNPTGAANNMVDLSQSLTATLTRVLMRCSASCFRALQPSLGSTVCNPCDFQGMTQFAIGTALGPTARVQIAGSRVVCGSSAGTAIVAGTTTATTVAPAANISILSLDVSVCGIAVSASGPSAIDITALTGSAATTGVLAQSGGHVTFSSSGTTLTGGTQDYSVDGTITGSFSSISAGACATTSGPLSNICSR